MVLLNKRASLEPIAFHVNLAYIFANLLLIHLRDGGLYDEDHELAEFDLVTRLFVRVVELKDVYRVDESVY